MSEQVKVEDVIDALLDQVKDLSRDRALLEARVRGLADRVARLEADSE